MQQLNFYAEIDDHGIRRDEREDRNFTTLKWL